MSTSPHTPPRTPAFNPLRVLWVEGSPKGARSTSSACASAFLDALEDSLGDQAGVVGVGNHVGCVEVTHLDVWNDTLPMFGHDGAIAKFAPLFGEQRTADQEALWNDVLEHIAHVRDHDAVVISCPMWNWSVPYRLKQWIDVITQPFVSFTLDADGRHVGVLGVDRHAQLILTRSSAYDGRSPEMTDYQRPYLEYLFGAMLGYTLADAVVIEPTTSFDADKRAAIHDRAVGTAAAAGAVFATTISAS